MIKYIFFYNTVVLLQYISNVVDYTNKFNIFFYLMTITKS